MRKALTIANMLFASATVFGMPFNPDDIRKAIENSMVTLQKEDINNFKKKAKEIHIELEPPFKQIISKANTVEDLENAGFENPGSYTLDTLYILKYQNDYEFWQRDNGSLLNGLHSQCPILALGVDESTMLKIQQLKTEETNREGDISLGQYMNRKGGLDPCDVDSWEAIARVLKCRIDIWIFPGLGRDRGDIEFYHVGGHLNKISSYGTQFNSVKRLRFDSGYDLDKNMSSNTYGHFTELRIFDQNGSQVN